MRAVWLSLCFHWSSLSYLHRPSKLPSLFPAGVSGQVVQDTSGMPIAKVEVPLVSANEGVVFSRWQRQKNALSAY
jgi:hypothetical protein